MGSQLNPILLGCFAKAEVSDLYASLVKENVLRFEVVVDDLVWQLVQVLDCVDDLSDDQLCLFLWDFAMFFEIEAKIRPLAVLKDGAERGRVHFDSIMQLNDIGM